MGQDRYIRDPLINMRQYGMFGTDWAYQLWWNESYYTTLSCGKKHQLVKLKVQSEREIHCLYMSVWVCMCVRVHVCVCVQPAKSYIFGDKNPTKIETIEIFILVGTFLDAMRKTAYT